MAALAMALVAGMALGDGPEPVSTATELRLVLAGRWEQTIRTTEQSGRKELSKPYYLEGGFVYNGTSRSPYRIIDEGNGHCRIESCGYLSLGIYKCEAGRIIVCIGPYHPDIKRIWRPQDFMPRTRYESIFTLRPANHLR